MGQKSMAQATPQLEKAAAKATAQLPEKTAPKAQKVVAKAAPQLEKSPLGRGKTSPQAQKGVAKAAPKALPKGLDAEQRRFIAMGERARAKHLSTLTVAKQMKLAKALSLAEAGA